MMLSGTFFVEMLLFFLLDTVLFIEMTNALVSNRNETPIFWPFQVSIIPEFILMYWRYVYIDIEMFLPNSSMTLVQQNVATC